MTLSTLEEPAAAERSGGARLSAFIRRPGIVHALLVLASCSLSAGAVLLTRGTGDVAAVWPVNAILLVVVLKWPRAEWPSLFGCLILGNLLANFLIGDPWLRCVILAGANSLEVLIVALIMTRNFKPRITSKAGIIRLCAASLIACSVSTPLALAGLAITGATLPLQNTVLWFFGDILGLLLFTPLLWALLAKRDHVGQALSWKSVVEGFLVVAVTIGVFAQSSFPLLFLVPPVVVPFTFRHGVRGAAVALLVVTAISIGFTYAGMGPTMLATGGVVEHMLVLQAFLAANSYMALTLGASVVERNRLNQRLRNSRRRIVERSTRENVLLSQAEMADEILHVGHWTVEAGTGDIYWSPEVYRIHGVTPETFDPMLGAALDFFAPEDREWVSDMIDRHMATGEDWDFEATLIRRSDGQRRRVRSIAKCQVNRSGSVESIFGVFKDITQEHELYAALAAKEEQYRLLAEHSTDIVLKFGLDGIINYASPSASVIASPEESIGKRTVDFVIPEDRDYAIAITQDLFTDKEFDHSVQREFRVRLADGSIVWLEGKPQIISDADGNAVEVVSTYRDVSERHEREKALAEARLEAELATVARTEFLSNMSHEIRTPLNGVLGFTDILKTTALTDDQLTYVQRISSAGRTLLEIVNDILDFSKIDAGHMDVEKRPYDLRAVIDDVVSLIAAARPNPNVKISCQVSPDVAAAVVGDETRVRQILTNIVGNAAKFTEAGHVRLDVRVRDGRLCMIVADTGPGIPADKIAHIFTGFSQADSTITRRFGGSGLGLSISRSLALLMDGDLEIVSEEGEGTNAIVTLPYIPDRRTGRAETPDMVEDRRAPTAARVMVVDDVEMNRALIEVGLRNAGHEVTSFSSAPEAILSLLEGTLYDIILMDVQMPEMDGLTATRRIREMLGPASRLPIVALTANVLASQAEECIAAGMDAHFAKPINMVGLNGLIDRLLRKKGTEDAERAAAADAQIEALKEDCRRDILNLPGQLGALLRISAPEERARAVAALAHSVAGTSGSLGFKDVSDAAFRLESVAKEIVVTGTPVSGSLEGAVDRFVSVAQAAA
ncbi:ATP-binding protein [Hyphomonas johnsonii]|uniref:histidine kinase n=1 Tax=Hyphomonas johnsonii MHS-2 TaxID=1280950 RepID=A0A059FPS1_9PROT|nr:ATP-binding protein [Hyphomonas johnsonii]KCZ92649.1 multi-sensor hybrid histidine kinase [Hyphomonas johnsonii MHS-2]